MKPLKLTMSAFGPYSGETEIDFRTLGRSGVYLVCGDTGAGKTMIFDHLLCAVRRGKRRQSKRSPFFRKFAQRFCRSGKQNVR